MVCCDHFNACLFRQQFRTLFENPKEHITSHQLLHVVRGHWVTSPPSRARQGSTTAARLSSTLHHKPRRLNTLLQGLDWTLQWYIASLRATIRHLAVCRGWGRGADVWGGSARVLLDAVGGVVDVVEWLVSRAAAAGREGAALHAGRRRAARQTDAAALPSDASCSLAVRLTHSPTR